MSAQNRSIRGFHGGYETTIRVGNDTKPAKIARNRLKKWTVTILLTYF